jgi:gamma-glutamylcyclotransferase (GGCT)/AIG2-like uncharacterized protein YtfP
MNDIIYYFAYGMLTDPNIIGDAKFVDRAVLPNWQFELLRFANVIPSHGDKVHGVIWAIDQEQLGHLDIIEGYPTLYSRKKLPIFDSKNTRYTAEVYMMTKNTRDRLINTSPSEPYLQSVERGYRSAQIPLDQIYDK